MSPNANTQISIPREERRDQTKLYNPMTIKELSEQMPGIPWLEYINTILAPHHVLTEKEQVIVVVPDYFPKLIDLLAKTSNRYLFLFSITKNVCTIANLYENRTLANYLMWRVSAASVFYLNEAARNLQLKYSAVLRGTSQQKPRWKECTDNVNEQYVTTKHKTCSFSFFILLVFT